MKKPLIFITNDDGVNALGFRTLVEAAGRIGRVIAIAPETTQSGKAHAITMYSPLYLRQVRKEGDVEVYACSGTPVDCVKMAFDHLLADNYPDISLSGINHGSNSAISVIYSGTMGAAIEASFYGRPAIGLSLADEHSNADFTAAAIVAEKIVRDVLGKVDELPLCLNVNVPAVPYEDIKGIRLCRQNRGHWKESFVCRQDPRGVDYFWLTGEFFNSEPNSEDTDEWALAHNYVSVVPIQTDLTNYGQLESLSGIIG
ncbi:MAG: 5'/3'-nucleotidase SurE [Alistipes sp.]|nr:5'/3'-nucleotidase SurE [Alistipes sp.]